MNEKFVTVANFAFGPDPVTQAHLAKLKLESEDIECFIQGENFVATYWLLSSADNGVKIKVPESQAKKAVEILSRDAEETKLEPEEIENPPCPKCSSTNVEFERFSRGVFALSILFLRFPIPVLKSKYKCKDCGCSWSK